MSTPDDEETPTDVDSLYLAVLSEDVEDFRSHLAGKNGGDPLPSSYFPPHTCWSPSEKDSFFRGLSVHSRLRPDLIAAEVKTKTIPDVCAYITLLEQAARDTFKNFGSTGLGLQWAREDIPSAIEVSDKWIAFEEGVVESLAMAHEEMEKDTSEKREEEARMKKNTIRAPKRGRGTGSKERDREGERNRRQEFDRWLAEKEAQWEVEDLFLSLDRGGLISLDRMLREDEETRAFNENTFALREDECAHAPTAPTQEGWVRSSVVSDNNFNDTVIDPMLLELSENAAPTTEVPLPQLSGTTPDSPLSSNNPLRDAPQPLTTPVESAVGIDEASTIDGKDLLQMSPVSRRRAQKRLHMRRKRAQATGTLPVEGAERLKPGRRPKQQSTNARSSSRLPEGGSQETVISINSRAPSPTQSARQPSSSIDADEEGGTVKAPFKRSTASGKTLPYKRQAQYMSKGVDIELLRKEGLDLFHLQTVSKLMRTYNQIQGAPDTVASEISAETLKLFRALVMRFISEVMSRAIVVREQERIAKLQTKAWRLRENQVVSSANVKHALALYGAESLSTSAHFANLLEELDNQSEDEQTGGRNEGAAESDDLSTDEDAEVDQEAEFEDTGDHNLLPPIPLSLLRTIFPPLTNYPASDRHTGGSSHSREASFYMPWPSSSLLANHSEPPFAEDLLPEVMDAAALRSELIEENAIEREDAARDKRKLQALWARVTPAKPGPTPTPGRRPRKRKRANKEASEDASRGSGSDSGSDEERDVEANLLKVDSDADDVAPRRPRKRRKGKSGGLSQNKLLYQEPGPNSRIKSAVYVYDSD